MPRFDVSVEIKQLHHLAVDALNAEDARSAAFLLLKDHDAERTEVHIEVERGAQ